MHAKQLQRAMHLLTPVCALCQEAEEDPRLWPLESELHVRACVCVCVCVCVGLRASARTLKCFFLASFVCVLAARYWLLCVVS